MILSETQFPPPAGDSRKGPVTRYVVVDSQDGGEISDNTWDLVVAIRGVSFVLCSIEASALRPSDPLLRPGFHIILERLGIL